MDIKVITYSIYLIISLAVTVWVARTLHKNGEPFLIDAFGNNQSLAASVNHLLVVGFYLINLGYVSVMLKAGIRPAGAAEAMELLSAKLGMVLLVLGGMHFINIYIFNKIRSGNLLGQLEPPVQPEDRIPSVR